MYIFLTIVAVFVLQIIYDWLVYKHRGRTLPDDPNDPNPPVVTGPEDARAQRLVDLAKKDKNNEMKD
jgi:hypothetical protein